MTAAHASKVGRAQQVKHLNRSISVVVVDDQQIVLAGVAAVIGAEEDVQVVGTAADLASALALIELTKPDVVLCDVQLGGESGLGLLDHVRPGGPAVLLLSAFEHPSYYQIALEHGASGYVAKAALVDQLVDAIRTVAGGGIVFPAHALRSRHGSARSPSRRELEVILHVAEGASNDEIGARLGISAKTVDSHLRSLFDRYGLVSRTDLAMHAVAEGWIRTAGQSVDAAPTGRWMIDERVASAR